MQEPESMSGLRTKLAELKSRRRTLQDQINKATTESKYSESELGRLAGDLERKEKLFGEKQERLEKYNVTIETAEIALQKLKETAARLTGILSEELEAVKGVKSGA
eukprot:TRINITY_DN15145_c0_g5_i1.p2 TRINITY_DN15145_c0_g5~~TRINITY_DN15145_c0_g5_i1.p2  ORF type:complete len:106 (-),score=40.12 TRINITY_DN15145_c0_g5_i1:177-494(-)